MFVGDSLANLKSAELAVWKSRQELKMESAAEIISPPPFLPVPPLPQPGFVLVSLPLPLTFILQKILTFDIRTFLFVESGPFRKSRIIFLIQCQLF